MDNEWKTLPAVTDFTYGDTIADPVTYQAKYGNDSVLVTYKKQGTEDTPSTTVPTEAGTYDVEVSLAETANYPALAPVQLTLTIRPKSLSDSDINVTLVGDTPVYDGTGKTRTVTVKFGETTLEEDTDYTLSGNTATTAGTHTLTVTGQGNYSGSTTKDWTITRASITPTVTIADTVYGETLNPGVNGNTENGAVTYTYYSDAACETVVTPKNVGTYYVRATIAETNNYQQATTTAQSFRITQKSVTVTITPNGGTYGDVTPAGATLGGVVAGDTVPVTLTYTGNANDGTSYDSTTAPSKAGTYTITAAISDGNYTLTGETTAQFVIEKATVTTPTPDSKTYTGETQTADIADTDRYTVTKNDGGIHADSYDVVLTLRDSHNYKWDDANGKTTFRITQADNIWKIAPTISGWTYGDTPGIPKGEAGFGTVTVEYTADGIAYSTTVPTKAGTYKARFTVADTGDFKGLSAEKTFTISKAPLTVTANDHTITYGDAPANNGVTYAGFVNSEDASVLVGTLTYTYSYSRYGNVGSYTITPKGLTSDKYDITFENGTLTVNRKEISITWGETSLSYTGAAQAPTATVTGLINGDACGITVIGKKTDVGDNYTAMANSLSNNNYKLPENKNNNCIFSITKVAPTFTAPTGKTVVYTGGELALAEGGETAHGTMQYRLSEDDEWSTAVPNGTDIGTYTIYYQVVGDKNHTNTEPGSVTAKILPFAIEKAPQNTTIDYGKDTRLTFEITTALEGEVTYRWYLVTDSEGGYVELPGETGSTLTLTKNNAGEYTYVCIVSCGEYSETSEEITVTVAPGEISVGTDVDLSGFWLEGGEAPASAGQTQILERSPSSRLLTKYTTSDSTQGDAYPSGMKVYRLDENNQPVEIEELGNLLQYSGCSIRVTGKKGIRMITSLTEEAKTALTKSNLAGYTLEEYGTVVQWKDDLNGASLTLANGNHNHAYKKGVSDPVFAKLSDLTQYTNVLVWESLTNEQLGKDIVMRPYIILKDADGETVTLYGGCVSRSIGYIAYQNRTVFNPGTADYKYVWDIIHAVYGTRYDSDYKG